MTQAWSFDLAGNGVRYSHDSGSCKLRQDDDYDSVGQLVEADPATGATLAWTYGTSGRRLTATDDDGTRQLDDITGPAGTRVFTYDAAGRRATDTTTPTSGTPATATSNDADFTGVVTFAGSVAVGTPGYSVTLAATHTWVQEIYDYPDWPVDRFCGGGLINYAGGVCLGF